LVEGNPGLAFHDEPVKILSQQNGNRLRQPADDTQLDVVNFVENTKGAVLKDRIRIQNK
jgi:hypothetical protein